MNAPATLILHQPGGRPWGMPNLSPFCSKLETYLRMAGWRYEWRPSDFRKAPKGKIPYIELDGQLLGDSQLIIEELERRRGRDALDAWLSDEQRAVGHAVRRMLDEALYFACIYLRWGVDEAWQLYRVPIARSVGPMAFLLPLIRRNVRKSLRAQGTGRHSPEEIERFAIADLDAVSKILDGHEFLLGERPSSYDASAFAFVEGVVGFPHPSRTREFAMGDSRLMRYRARIRERWWGDLSAE
ncbi:MAG: glutathione S-transferase family protein [Steroidobacteraceae bacterium]